MEPRSPQKVLKFTQAPRGRNFGALRPVYLKLVDVLTVWPKRGEDLPGKAPRAEGGEGGRVGGRKSPPFASTCSSTPDHRSADLTYFWHPLPTLLAPIWLPRLLVGSPLLPLDSLLLPLDPFRSLLAPLWLPVGFLFVPFGFLFPPFRGSPWNFDAFARWRGCGFAAQKIII